MCLSANVMFVGLPKGTTLVVGQTRHYIFLIDLAPLFYDKDDVATEKIKQQQDLLDIDDRETTAHRETAAMLTNFPADSEVVLEGMPSQNPTPNDIVPGTHPEKACAFSLNCSIGDTHNFVYDSLSQVKQNGYNS